MITGSVKFHHEDVGTVTVTGIKNRRSRGIWFVVEEWCDVCGYSAAMRMFNRIDNEDRMFFTDKDTGETLHLISAIALLDILSEDIDAYSIREWILYDVLPNIDFN